MSSLPQGSVENWLITIPEAKSNKMRGYKVSGKRLFPDIKPFPGKR